MDHRRAAWRMGKGLCEVGITAALVLILSFLGLLPAGSASAVPLGREEHYRCGGEPLVARVDNGPVDATGIPNMTGGTVPGAFVVLRWKDITLQLPRTNNAGTPSFTDGKWWWSLEDPDHPRFQLRRGDIRDFSCRREP